MMLEKGATARQPLRSIENKGMISIPKLKALKRPTVPQEAVVSKLEELRLIVTTHISDPEVVARTQILLEDIAKIMGVETAAVKFDTLQSPSMVSDKNYARPANQASSTVKFAVDEKGTDKKSKTPKSTGKFTTSKIASAVAEVERSANIKEDAIEESIYGFGACDIPESPFSYDSSRLSVDIKPILHWDSNALADSSKKTTRSSAKKVHIMRGNSFISPSLTADDVDSDAETVYAKTPATARGSRAKLSETPVSATHHLCLPEVDTPVTNTPGTGTGRTTRDAQEVAPPAVEKASTGGFKPESEDDNSILDVREEDVEGGVLHWNVDNAMDNFESSDHNQAGAVFLISEGLQPSFSDAEVLPDSTDPLLAVVVPTGVLPPLIDPVDEFDPLNIAIDNDESSGTTAGFGRRKASSRRASIRCKENLGVMLLGVKKSSASGADAGVKSADVGVKKGSASGADAGVKSADVGVKKGSASGADVGVKSADVGVKKASSRRGVGGGKKNKRKDEVELGEEQSETSIVPASATAESTTGTVTVDPATTEVSAAYAPPAAIAEAAEEEEEEELPVPVKAAPKKRAYNRRGSIRSRVSVEELLRQEEEEEEREKAATTSTTTVVPVEVVEKKTRGRPAKKKAEDDLQQLPQQQQQDTATRSSEETHVMATMMLPSSSCWDEDQGLFDGDDAAAAGGMGMLHWNNEDQYQHAAAIPDNSEDIGSQEQGGGGGGGYLRDGGNNAAPIHMHHMDDDGSEFDAIASAIEVEPVPPTPKSVSKGKKRGNFNRRASIRSRVPVEEILRQQGLGDDDEDDDDDNDGDGGDNADSSSMKKIGKVVPFSLLDTTTTATINDPSMCSIDVLQWQDDFDLEGMATGTLHWDDSSAAASNYNNDGDAHFQSSSVADAAAAVAPPTPRAVRTSPTKKRLVQEEKPSTRGTTFTSDTTSQPSRPATQAFYAAATHPEDTTTEVEKLALKEIVREAVSADNLRGSLQMLKTTISGFDSLAASVRGVGILLLSASTIAATTTTATATASSQSTCSDATITGLSDIISKVLPLLQVSPGESQQPTDDSSASTCASSSSKSTASASAALGKSKTTVAAAATGPPKKSALKKGSSSSTEPTTATATDRSKGAKGGGGGGGGGAKKGIRFCMVDGSSVCPPNDREENSWMPALHSSRRLNSLIALVDELIGDDGRVADGNSSSSRSDSSALLLAIAKGAKALAISTVTASEASTSLQEHLSITCNTEEILMSAKILKHEFALAVSTPSLQLRRKPCTALRFRAAWVATSVLRAQLRWLFDCPPPSISVPAIAGEIAYSGCRSKLHTVISLRARPVVVPSYLSPSKSNKKRKKSDNSSMDHTIVIPSEMPISTLVTLAMKQIFHALCVLYGEKVGDDGDDGQNDNDIVTDRTTEVLSAAVSVSSSSKQGSSSKELSSSLLSLDELAKTQPQIALAAERGRLFLLGLITHPIVAACNKHEVSLWNIMAECAETVAIRGMPEDKHLCIFRGGWQGIQQFSGERLLSVSAEKDCQQFVDALIHDLDLDLLLEEREEALLLHCSLIYDFPEIVEIPKS